MVGVHFVGWRIVVASELNAKLLRESTRPSQLLPLPPRRCALDAALHPLTVGVPRQRLALAGDRCSRST
eukprot:8196234-Alexandrium_andersonii.AAC.1